MAHLVVATEQKATAAHENALAPTAAGERVRDVAALAALVLFARLEDDVTRRDAKFVFA